MIGEAAQTLPVQATRAQTSLAGQGTATDALNRSFTRKERAVLEAICNPALRDVTVSERAKAAGVSERRYFEIMKDPWFRRQHREYIQATVQERVASLVDASAQTAATPGRDGFNDRRMLLEITGHYVPRQQTDVTSGGQPIVGVIGVDPGQL